MRRRVRRRVRRLSAPIANRMIGFAPSSLPEAGSGGPATLMTPASCSRRRSEWAATASEGVLSSAHHRGVDGDDPVEVALGTCLCEQSGEDRFPRAVDRPHSQPSPRAHRRDPPDRPCARPSWQCRDAAGLPVPAPRRTPVIAGRKAHLRRKVPAGFHRSLDSSSNSEHKFHTPLSSDGPRWSRLTVLRKLGHGATNADPWVRCYGQSAAACPVPGVGVINSWSPRGAWGAGSTRGFDGFRGGLFT